jgi:hypothetical protein
MIKVTVIIAVAAKQDHDIFVPRCLENRAMVRKVHSDGRIALFYPCDNILQNCLRVSKYSGQTFSSSCSVLRLRQVVPALIKSSPIPVRSGILLLT